MLQQIQSACSDCNGVGERINPKDRCKTCNGKKVSSDELNDKFPQEMFIHLKTTSMNTEYDDYVFYW